MMTSIAIDYYRNNRRVVEALRLSFGKRPRRTRSTKLDLDTFLQQNDKLRLLEQSIKEFNIFAALGVAENEIRHSRILAWLLNPKESHGQGIRYIKAFLTLVFKEDGVNAEDHSIDYEQIRVVCEHDRIDILLVDDINHIVCAIENKIRTDQHSHQLFRYRKLIETKYPQFEQKFVFLTLNGGRPLDSSYIPLDYERVLCEVIGGDAPISTSSEDAQGRALLFNHYAKMILSKGKQEEAINILNILHFTQHELKHSNFLAWLLQPHESHGLGDAFYRFLLQLLATKGVNLPPQITNLPVSDLEVRRECENIDILCLSEKSRFALVIENKILAREHSDQLNRYREFAERHFSGDHLVYVFLDLKQLAPSASEYTAISYNDLLPFFDTLAQGTSLQCNSERIASLLVRHYRRLLAAHLWVKKNTRIELPYGISAMCKDIAEDSPVELAALLEHITEWQQSLAPDLEKLLYSLAIRFLGDCFTHTYQVWYRFIPKSFDHFPTLRNGGGDPCFDGRLAIYEFFVIPFGDSVSVRKPGIYLELKLMAAKQQFAEAKEKLQLLALDTPMFNRAKGKASKKKALLSYRLCSFDESVRCTRAELKQILSNRLERFARSLHPDILKFFETHLDSSRI